MHHELILRLEEMHFLLQNGKQAFYRRDQMKSGSPLTQHEQDSLHLSLLGRRVKLAGVEPQFLPPGK